MSVKLLAKHHLEFLSLKGGCTGSSESILVKMLYCWKSSCRGSYGSAHGIFCTKTHTDVSRGNRGLTLGLSLPDLSDLSTSGVQYLMKTDQ